jgi:hypothetical protein
LCCRRSTFRPEGAHSPTANPARPSTCGRPKEGLAGASPTHKIRQGAGWRKRPDPPSPGLALKKPAYVGICATAPNRHLSGPDSGPCALTTVDGKAGGPGTQGSRSHAWTGRRAALELKGVAPMPTLTAKQIGDWIVAHRARTGVAAPQREVAPVPTIADIFFSYSSADREDSPSAISPSQRALPTAIECRCWRTLLPSPAESFQSVTGQTRPYPQITPGSGAPFGRRNDNYRHGYFTAEAKEFNSGY